MCACVLSHVLLWNTMNFNPPGSSVYWILQARIVELPFPPLENLPYPGMDPMSPASADRFFTAGPHGKPIKWSSCSQLGIFSRFTLDDLFNISPRDAQSTSFKVGFKCSSEELNHYFCSSEAVISKTVNWWMLCVRGTTLKHINRNKTSNSENIPVHWWTPWNTIWARSETVTSMASSTTTLTQK